MSKEGVDSGDYVKWFSELNKYNFDVAGWKGANLGELYREKFPVPPGFVLTCEAFDFFLDKNGIRERINSILSSSDSLKDKSSQIRELIGKSEIPKEIKEAFSEAYDVLDVNKKSLGTASSDALSILQNSHEPPFISIRGSPINENIKTKSLLNVKGMPGINKKIKSVFSSAFSEDNLEYYGRKSLSLNDLRVGVVIQKMIDSQKSGRIFSKNPSQKDDNIIIKGIFGLGAGLTLRGNEPDTYLMNKNFDILKSKVNNKTQAVVRDSSGDIRPVALGEEARTHEVLSGYELKRLGQIAMSIDEHYGEPQEIDFAVDGREFFVLQTKAIDFKKTRIEEFEESPQEDEDFTEGTEKESDLPDNVVKIEDLVKKKGKHPLYFLKENKMQDYIASIHDGLKKVADKFNEVKIRTSDFRSDKHAHLEGSGDKERNPSQGYRGIRFGLKNVDVLESELKAVKEVADEFPEKKFSVAAAHLISADEFRKFKQIAGEVGMPNNVKVGAMIETPAAVHIVDELCQEGVDFVSIGLENLTRHTLAVDEDNDNISELYDEAHPAVLRSIGHVFDKAHENNLKADIFESEEQEQVPNIDEEEVILSALEEEEQEDEKSAELYTMQQVKSMFESTKAKDEYRPDVNGAKDKQDIPSLNEAIPIGQEHFKDIENGKKEEVEIIHSTEETPEENERKPEEKIEEEPPEEEEPESEVVPEDENK